jgi:hypothetical protein
VLTIFLVNLGCRRYEFQVASNVCPDLYDCITIYCMLEPTGFLLMVLQDLLAEVLPPRVVVLDSASPVANRVRFLLKNDVKVDGLLDALVAGRPEGQSYLDLKVTGDPLQVEKTLSKLDRKGAKLPTEMRLRTCSTLVDVYR